MSVTPDQILDCVDLTCPMPVLRTKQAIDALEVGQVLQLTATDHRARTHRLCREWPPVHLLDKEDLRGAI